MATSKFLRTFRTNDICAGVVASSPSTSSLKNNAMWCLTSNKGEPMNKESIAFGINARNSTPTVLRKVSVTSSSHLTTANAPVHPGMIDLASVVVYVRHALFVLLKISVKPKLRNLHLQMLIERVVIDCRFFTLLAVFGSLIGSVLCFLEGCFLMLESYFQYFHTLSQRLDGGHVIPLLIEAIDVFLVGTAMVIFGVSLHVIFVRPNKKTKEDESLLSKSNSSKLLHIKAAATWMGMQSIARAKSTIGYAVMLILQVGLLEKLQNIPLATGLDLACLAAAILISSASVYLLSKLNSK